MSAIPPLPTKTYDFSAVTLTWNGITCTGGAESYKAARDEDAFTKHVSGDGTTTRALNSNRGGYVEIVFGQNATCLDLLSQQAILDSATGTALGPIEVKDARGTTLVTAPNAWIKKTADVDFQKEVQMRSWTFDCDNITIFCGSIT